LQAVVIAGGEGTRLRPLTTTTPKPLLPVANQPILSHVLQLLHRHGIDDVVISVAYLANAIRSYLGDGSDIGMRIRYVQEESPLGTAGAVANARELLNDTFLVMSGDVITDFDLSDAVKVHRDHDAVATVLLSRVSHPTEFGIVMTDDDEAVTSLVEKPSWGGVFTDAVNTGVYICEPSVLDLIQRGVAVDFAQDVFPALLERKVPFFGHVAPGYWADVGTFNGYLQTHRDMLDEKVDLDLPGFRITDGVWIGRNCEIDPSVSIEGPSLIGDDVHVGVGAHILPYTVLGRNVRISADAVISGSVVYDHCYVGERGHVEGAIVGRHTDVRAGAYISSGAVLADDVYVGRDAVITTDIKVYPGKRVEPMSTVTSSIVWEAGAARTIFEGEAVSGLANIDITPELATRIAMAMASSLPAHSTVIAARDTSRAARVMKRSIMVGFNAVGLDVLDLEATTLPVLRHHIASSDVSAGVWVALDSDDSQSLSIRLLGRSGTDLSHDARRKVERALEREDFRRVTASEIGDLRAVSRNLEGWSRSILGSLAVKAIRNSHAKVVVDYSFGLAASTLPTILAQLNLEALAINPYAATRGLLARDLGRQCEVLSTLLRASDSTLGVVIDPTGEGVTCVDETGHILSDDELTACLVDVVCRMRGSGELVLPINLPGNLAERAAGAGQEVTWCGLSTSDLISTVASRPSGNAFGLASPGRIVAQQIPATPDAAFTLGLILGALAENKMTLSEVRLKNPVPITQRSDVPLPHFLVGAAMRRLVAYAQGFPTATLALVDGIRVDFPRGFWLAAPDNSRPVCHLYVAHDDAFEAEANLRQLESMIAQIRDND